jgi:hypothetical protein
MLLPGTEAAIHGLASRSNRTVTRIWPAKESVLPGGFNILESSVGLPDVSRIISARARDNEVSRALLCTDEQTPCGAEGHSRAGG